MELLKLCRPERLKETLMAFAPDGVAGVGDLVRCKCRDDIFLVVFAGTVDNNASVIIDGECECETIDRVYEQKWEAYDG